VCGQYAQAAGASDLTFHGGPVMHTTTTYAIFWLPPGRHFEPAGHGTDTRFRGLVTQFLSDIGGTTYYAIATQYSDDAGPVRNVSRFGGAVVDTHPYAADATGIATEVIRTADDHHWPGGLSTLFLVFAASGAFHAFDFHSSSDLNGTNYVFAAYLNPYVCGSCNANGYDPSGIASPNRDTTFDLDTRTISHEMMEAVTDPLGVSWYDAVAGADGGELADKCVGVTAGVSGDGANVSLHGHRYSVATLWSNEVHGCAASLGPSEPARASVSDLVRTPRARYGRFTRRP
jgi:hypothetical protein